MATQTGSYDFNAAKKAYDAGSTKATSFIFKTTGKDAWVCDENHGPQMSGANAGEPYGPSSMTPTTGWRIGDMFDMVRIGVSWFRVWVESGVAKMRLGRSDASHITLDSNGMDVSDGTDSVAAFGATGRIGKTNGSRFVLESAKLQAYNSSNVKYFEVSASGMTFGTDTVATTDDIPTKVSDLTNDSSFATTSQLPTKVSDLTNDSHFATTSQLPTKTSDLTNDSSFATTGQLPTKTSDLTNDSSFATTSQLPTKTSDLTNDSSFATSNDVSTAKSAAEKVATNFIQNVTSGGVFVHRSESGKNGSTPTATNAYGVHIADNINIIKAGVSVAEYGDTARVGKANGPRTVIQSSGMDVYGESDGSVNLAHIGADFRIGSNSGYNISVADSGMEMYPSKALWYKYNGETIFYWGAANQAAPIENAQCIIFGKFRETSSYKSVRIGANHFGSGQNALFLSVGTESISLDEAGNSAFPGDINASGTIKQNNTAVSLNGHSHVASDVTGLEDSGWQTSGTIKYRKHHGVVYVAGISNNSLTINTGGVLAATLPSGYRPSTPIAGALSTTTSNPGQFYIGTDGTITLWNLVTSNAHWRFSTSFPV